MRTWNKATPKMKSFLERNLCVPAYLLISLLLLFSNWHRYCWIKRLSNVIYFFWLPFTVSLFDWFIYKLVTPSKVILCLKVRRFRPWYDHIFIFFIFLRCLFLRTLSYWIKIVLSKSIRDMDLTLTGSATLCLEAGELWQWKGEFPLFIAGDSPSDTV